MKILSKFQEFQYSRAYKGNLKVWRFFIGNLSFFLFILFWIFRKFQFFQFFTFKIFWIIPKIDFLITFSFEIESESQDFSCFSDNNFFQFRSANSRLAVQLSVLPLNLESNSTNPMVILPHSPSPSCPITITMAMIILNPCDD